MVKYFILLVLLVLGCLTIGYVIIVSMTTETTAPGGTQDGQGEPHTRVPTPNPRAERLRDAVEAGAKSGDVVAKKKIEEALADLDGEKTKSVGRTPSQPERPKAGAVPADVVPIDPPLPEKLKPRQISRVVKKSARALVACKGLSGYQEGLVTVRFVIAKSGKVSSAKLTTAQFKQTPVGECVVAKIKTFRFPQFSGPPMQINYPFHL